MLEVTPSTVINSAEQDLISSSNCFDLPDALCKFGLAEHAPCSAIPSLGRSARAVSSRAIA